MGGQINIIKKITFESPPDGMLGYGFDINGNPVRINANGSTTPLVTEIESGVVNIIANLGVGLEADLPSVYNDGDIYVTTDTFEVYTGVTAGTDWSVTPLLVKQFVTDTSGSSWIIYQYNSIELKIVGDGGTDDKVRVSATDTTNDYLNAKLTVGDEFTKEIGSPAANETLLLKFKGWIYNAARTFKAILSFTGTADRTYTLLDESGTIPLLQSASTAFTGNVIAPNINGFETTATAAGTTTLTATSTYNQEFTGTTTQTIVMPVASTLVLGRSFKVINTSTGVLTIQSSGTDEITTIAAGITKIIICNKITGTDETSWVVNDFGGVIYEPATEPVIVIGTPNELTHDLNNAQQSVFEPRLSTGTQAINIDFDFLIRNDTNSLSFTSFLKLAGIRIITFESNVKVSAPSSLGSWVAPNLTISAGTDGDILFGFQKNKTGGYWDLSVNEKVIGEIISRFTQRVSDDSGTFENQICLENEINSLGGFVNDFTYLLTANAYKTSKIYAIKPENGDGDLTFSRSSIATRIFNEDIETKSINVPRLDAPFKFTCPNIQLENPFDENVHLYSEQIDDPKWVKGGMTVLSNSIISPDGTMNADSVVETAVFSGHFVYQRTSSVTPKDYCFSFFIKQNGREWIFVQVRSETISSGVSVWFNLADKSKGQYSEFGSAYTLINYSIEEYNDGWLRVKVVATATSGTTLRCHVRGAVGDNDSSDYTGDITKGFYLWGCQLIEALDTGSYIPTTSAFVRRQIDIISTKTGLSSYIGTSGTIYFKGTMPETNEDKRITLTDGTTNNRIILIFTNTNYVRLYIQNTSSEVDYTHDEFFRFGSEIRVAIAYETNSTILYINGENVHEDTSCSIPIGLDRIDFSDGGVQFYGKIKILGISNTKLSDSNCIALTTQTELQPAVKDIVPLTFSGTDDYYAFGRLFLTGTDTGIYITRRGSTHINGVDISGLDFDINSKLFSKPRQIAITGDADIYSGVAGGVIGSNIYIFVAKYNVGSNTFTDIGYLKSTDLAGTSWGSYVSLSTLLTYERFECYGGLIESTTSGKYFQPWFEHKSGATDPWRVNILKTVDSGVNWTNINVYDGSTAVGEPSLLHISGTNYLIFARDLDNDDIRLFSSTDDCETWTNVGLTGLGAGTGDCNCDTVLVDGLIQIIFQDRGTGYIMISKDTTYANALTLTFDTAKHYDYNGNDDAYNGLGYPSIVQLDGSILYLNWAKESSTSEAHIYGTMCDLDDI